ncbi:MAG TPA: DUF177 domain-containing protein [Methylomirabilota bacterium]|jgi:uncharacterized protein|nr:DUF177 domain-containing protein [Methylomirabilota bacterium]
MIVRVSEIPEEGLQIHAPADVAPVFTDEGWSLDRVGLRIERRSGEVMVTGNYRATVRLQCGRCLEGLTTHVGSDVDLRLLPSTGARHEEVELGPDDLELDFYQGDSLDVGGLLRSETFLALPMKPLCRPDCRGLCPACGGNRNVTACACAAGAADPRLAPLEALRRRL